MGLDQSGVLTVGSLVSKEGRHTLPHNTLLVIPPLCSKPPFTLALQGHYIRAVPMQHMVNKAHTRWVAAILITLETIGMGLQGTDRVSAVLSKQ